MELCSLAEVEIPVSRLWASGISVKVQKGSHELLVFSVPFQKKANPLGITKCLGLDGTTEDPNPSAAQLSLKHSPRMEEFIWN